MPGVASIRPLARPDVVPHPVALGPLNGETGERAYYAFPTQQQTAHIHVWDSIIQEAGMSMDDIPNTWHEYWEWFCTTGQDAGREVTGDRRFYGIGQPMSSSASELLIMLARR